MRAGSNGKKSSICFTSVLVLAAVCASLVSAAPAVAIQVDQETYQWGDAIEVRLSGRNDDEATDADVYIGLFVPSGALYVLGQSGWSDTLEPWIRNLHIPSPFYMGVVPFKWFHVPSDIPPIVEHGEHTFAAALANPGTLMWISTPSLAPFAIWPPVTSHYCVDGEVGNDSNYGSEALPWKTITHALETVGGSQAHPATIHIAPGTYAASTNGETYPLNMRSWVSLEGADAETTVLDGEDGAGYIIYSDAVNNLGIEHFTITRGGGIGCIRSSPRIRDNLIVRNQATHGGGIYCKNGSSPIIENNIISGNLAGYGSGIYCCDSSSPVVKNNIISDNTDYHGGGGVYCDESSAPKIINNLIVGNSATLGAGIYYHDQSPPTIENNTISANTAKYGDGIYCATSQDRDGRGELLASFAGSEDTATIRDCIVWGNGDDSRGASDDDGLYRDLYCCSAVYSCIEQEEEGEGNIHDDPMFVTGLFGGYYLAPSSPCIDAGSRSAEEAGLSDRTTQADGTLDTGAVDMGFHYPVP